MLVKSEQDEIQSFLGDASNTAGGRAERVLFPESAEEVARRIVETYDKPDVDVHAAISARDSPDFDILLSFSETCRRDMAMEHGTNLGRAGRHCSGARNELRQSLLT